MSDLLQLFAGPLSVLLDPEHALLRYVRLGQHEIVRSVYAAVRDRDWNTIPFSVHDLMLEHSDVQFSLSFVAKSETDDIQYQWRGRISGSPAGVIHFRFDGEALKRFLKNRIGLCVLHPIRECAGQPCRVEHVDGMVTKGCFPLRISPHQPFQNIKSITHSVQPGCDAKVSFEGETFEMEDQRNWTDASFKTYSTPLKLPFPAEVKTGSQIHHLVTIELVGRFSRAQGHERPVPHTQPPRVSVDWSACRTLPPIGLSMSTDRNPPSAAVIRHLTALNLDHLRVDLHLGDDTWLDGAHAAVELAGQLGASLEVALFCADVTGADWQRCVQLFRERRARIARWLVFHPTERATPAWLAEVAYDELRRLDASIPVVLGTNAYFAELNRNPPPVIGDSLVCYSINPQVHTFDNRSVCETLEAQRATVDSAFDLFGRPVVISPITLRPRFNPNATSATVTGAEHATPETDSRQATGFAAAWTVGALAQLATHPKVASLTFYETFGPRGIMDATGSVYPLYSVFQALHGCKAICETTRSTMPVDVAIVGLTRMDHTRHLLLANLSSKEMTVLVDGGASREVPLTIDPQSVRRIPAEELL